MNSDTEAAYDHCVHITKSEAKNFYLAFRTLPYTKRRPICAAYAFCRVCDDSVDEDISIAEKQSKLATIRTELACLGDGTTRNPIFRALSEITNEFEIPNSLYEQFIQGVEMDVTGTRFSSFQDLQEYCYKVASVVGLICMKILNCDTPATRRYAIDIGYAMQLTNIIRDVKEDALRGRIYIPLDEIELFGYSESRMLNGVVDDAFRSLMSFQEVRARAYFEKGMKLLTVIPRDSRTCFKVLCGAYILILDRIVKSGFELFDNRISLTTTERLFLIGKLWVVHLLLRALPFQRK